MTTQATDHSDLVVPLTAAELRARADAFIPRPPTYCETELARISVSPTHQVRVAWVQHRHGTGTLSLVLEVSRGTGRSYRRLIFIPEPELHAFARAIASAMDLADNTSK